MTILRPALLIKFSELAAKDPSAQCELFLKTFIFALGDNWNEVPKLLDEWRKYLNAIGATTQDIDLVNAADFFQKNATGLRKQGTGDQRREELQDIDVDKNNRVTFVEYLLLQYKGMVLQEYYKRMETVPPCNLNNEEEVSKIIGYSNELVEQLFTLPQALDPATEEAIEAFTMAKRTRIKKMEDLKTLADKGGVKGMAAKNELAQMKAGDITAINRMELTLNATKRAALKKSGEMMLMKKQLAEEKRIAKEREEAKMHFKARSALWA